jgi:hypothetical protein
MPVARYFLYIGGVLLALLFAIDAFVPQEAALASHSAPGIDKSTVRIHSAQKLPDRVVYDTSLPTIVPPAAKTQVAAAAPPAPVDVSAKPFTQASAAQASAAQARVRDTFAQFVPNEPKKAEPQVQHKRKVAKVRAAQPVRLAQQQPHFGFFGGANWNSTW